MWKNMELHITCTKALKHAADVINVPDMNHNLKHVKGSSFFLQLGFVVGPSTTNHTIGSMICTINNHQAVALTVEQHLPLEDQKFFLFFLAAHIWTANLLAFSTPNLPITPFPQILLRWCEHNHLLNSFGTRWFLIQSSPHKVLMFGCSSGCMANTHLSSFPRGYHQPLMKLHQQLFPIQPLCLWNSFECKLGTPVPS